MINDKYAVQTNAHSSIRYGIGISVSKTGVEWIELVWEKVSDIFQCRNFEHLRLPMNNFTFEGAEKPVRAQNNWSIWHYKILFLPNSFNILTSVICLSNRSRSKIEEFIAFLINSSI